MIKNLQELRKFFGTFRRLFIEFKKDGEFSLSYATWESLEFAPKIFLQMPNKWIGGN